MIENAIGGGGSDRLIGNQVDNRLTGGTGRDVFELRNGGTTGVDQVTDWMRGDMLAVDKSLRDSNGDGIITWTGSTLRLDTGDSDAVRLTGGNGSAGLRLMGGVDGTFHYANARVAPTAKKGQVVHVSDFGDNALGGGSSRTVSDVFFFDTANPVGGLGNDRVNFSAHDLIVTTTALTDINADGITRFNGGALNLSGTGGTVAVTGTNTLEYDGMIEQNGMRYYVYSAVGSSVGLSDIHI